MLQIYWKLNLQWKFLQVLLFTVEKPQPWTNQNQKNMLQEHKGVDKDGASFRQGCQSIKHSTHCVKPARPAT